MAWSLLTMWVAPVPTPVAVPVPVVVPVPVPVPVVVPVVPVVPVAAPVVPPVVTPAVVVATTKVPPLADDPVSVHAVLVHVYTEPYESAGLAVIALKSTAVEPALAVVHEL